MNIVNEKEKSLISKNEIEQVELQKKEYTFLGKFLRTPGLKLFGYNSLKNEIFEVEINYSNTLHLLHRNGVLTAVDLESEKCLIDNSFEYFEALNIISAKKRVRKFKDGKIKELINLRKYEPNAIKKYFDIPK